MREVWKFEVDNGMNYFDVPSGCKCLTAKRQKESFCVWVEVNPNEIKREQLCIEVVMTGESFPIARREYIGTELFANGNFVLHAYRRIL